MESSALERPVPGEPEARRPERRVPSVFTEHSEHVLLVLERHQYGLVQQFVDLRHRRNRSQSARSHRRIDETPTLDVVWIATLN
jgi:hypothetical protein